MNSILVVFFCYGNGGGGGGRREKGEGGVPLVKLVLFVVSFFCFFLVA